MNQSGTNSNTDAGESKLISSEPGLAHVEKVVEPDTRSQSRSRYEESSREVTQDLSLKEISQVLIQNWPLFVLLFFLFSAASVLVYSLKVPYVSRASVILNDSQNSSLQSFSNQYAGAGKVNEAKKSNSPLQKHLEYLKTTEFYDKVLSQALLRGQQNNLSLAEKNGFMAFKKTVLAKSTTKSLTTEQQVQIFSQIEDMMKIKILSDYELEISTSSLDPDLALFLTNATVTTIADVLKTRELNDVTKMKEFLKKQIEQTDKNLTEINKKIADFQNKPENLISLSSKDKVGEYLSELMVRKNETLMKMAENQKVIRLLDANRGGGRESQLYGNGGRVSAIQIENDMLRARLGDIQNSINRVSQEAKGIPLAAQMYEDLKKKSEIEFTRYKELSESLSKSQGYELSLANKFEVLEMARAEKVRTVVSLLTLILVSFIVSQVLGSVIIYVKAIWNTSLVTAQSTRNVVVVDSHSLDPRVIIENSKIKFRLRHNEFDQDFEDGKTKRLGFSLFKKAPGDDGASSSEDGTDGRFS